MTDPDEWLRAAAGFVPATDRIRERDIDDRLDAIAADESLGNPDRAKIDTPAVREWVAEQLGGTRPVVDLKQGRFGDPFAGSSEPTPEDYLRSAYLESKEHRYDRRVQRRAKDEKRERTDREDESRRQRT